MTTPAVSRALEELENKNVKLTVENSNIRVAYRCPATVLPTVRRAIAILRQHKQEAIVLLAYRPSVSSDGDWNWPLQNLEAEMRFGCIEARLYPFIGKQVRTPLGPGKLLHVFKTRATVVLDTEAATAQKDQKVRLFDPADICPPEVM